VSGAPERDQRPARIESISAVTLATHDMARSVGFYRAMGFALRYGGEAAAFTSFSAGNACLNVTTEGSEREWSWWGRVIFYVDDVDALHRQAVAAGLQPQTAPRDATWGERYFHISDPDGHELSFATPLARVKR
jgi:catechol 2,3-dioxygenase-like lactoylglutathione lyase family enzyme